MDLKKITIIQLVITFILAVSLIFVFDYKVALGIILGSGVSYLDYYLLNKRITNLTDKEIPDLNKILKKNKNFRYLIMILTLMIAGFIPQLFNIISVCLSVLINKISIYISTLISKK